MSHFTKYIPVYFTAKCSDVSTGQKDPGNQSQGLGMEGGPTEGELGGVALLLIGCFTSINPITVDIHWF